MSLQLNAKLVVLRESISHMTEIHATFLVQLFFFRLEYGKVCRKDVSINSYRCCLSLALCGVNLLESYQWRDCCKVTLDCC